MKRTFLSLNVGAEENCVPDTTTGKLEIPWRSCVAGFIEAKPPTTVEQIQPAFWQERGLVLRDGVARRVRGEDRSDSLQFSFTPTKLDDDIYLDFYVAGTGRGPTPIESHTVHVVSPFPFLNTGLLGKSISAPSLKHKRSAISQKIIDTVRATPEYGDAVAKIPDYRIVLLHGPTGCGKTTLLQESIDQLKQSSDITVVQISATEIMQAGSRGEILRRVDQVLHVAYAPEPRGKEAGLDNATYWWANLADALTYERSGPKIISEFLLERKPASAFVVLVVDEIDRIATPPVAFETAQILSILIDEILLNVLDGLRIRGVLLLADWEEDFKARWPILECLGESRLVLVSLGYFKASDIRAYIENLFDDLVINSSWKDNLACLIHELSGGIPVFVNVLLEQTLRMWLKSGRDLSPANDYGLRELREWALAPNPDTKQRLNKITQYLTETVSTQSLTGNVSVKKTRLTRDERDLLGEIAEATSKRWRDPPPEIPVLVARGLIEFKDKVARLSSPLLKDYLVSKRQEQASRNQKGRR